jgi:hypothetical protein
VAIVITANWNSVPEKSSSLNRKQHVTHRRPGFCLGVSPGSRGLAWLGNELQTPIESVGEPV